MQPTRRHVLAVGLFGLGTACTSRPKATPAVVDPDLELITAARSREQVLLDAYGQAVAAHPELSAELANLSAHHSEHLAALGLSTAPATPADAQPVPARLAPSTSATARAARARLSNLEREAANAHGAAAVLASRALAPILASLGACEAAHAAVLQIP